MWTTESPTRGGPAFVTSSTVTTKVEASSHAPEYASPSECEKSSS